MEKNIPKVLNAWVLYDWANSVYSLVITATLFPIYYNTIAQQAGVGAEVLGLSLQAVYSFSISISFILVIILSPILSSIADAMGNKKLFLRIFSTVGSVSCIALYFFQSPESIYWGLLCSILASLGFWGSLVFYNSYLPDIATEDRHDDLSAKGYSLGYLGGTVLLIICLALVFLHDKIHLSEPEAYRICFVLVGLWWISFAQYTLTVLPKGLKNEDEVIDKDIIKESFKELYIVQKELFNNANIKNFLLGFFFYSVGVQTIFYLAIPFGTHDLKIPAIRLILTVLGMQILAIIGAVFYAKLSDKKGNKFALQAAIVLWMVACVFGFFIRPEDSNAQIYFYILAGMVSLVMGGIQSLSRSTYSKLLPETTDTTIYFSFFDVLEKIAIVVGTSTIGVLIEQYGEMRYGVLSMAFFFLLGFFCISRFQKKSKE